MSLNDDAWDTIFTELRIVEQVNAAGYIDITAPQIKRISQREPRLMTKIDFREQLPPAMRRENLAILAIANGTYRIGRFDPFITIETKIQANFFITSVSQVGMACTRQLGTQLLGSHSSNQY